MMNHLGALRHDPPAICPDLPHVTSLLILTSLFSASSAACKQGANLERDGCVS